MRRGEGRSVELVTDDDKTARAASAEQELNFMDGVTLKSIRTKKYPHPISDAYLKELQAVGEVKQTAEESSKDNLSTAATDGEQIAGAVAEPQPTAADSEDQSQNDTPDVPLRFSEKKRLHWTGKTCKHRFYTRLDTNSSSCQT